MHSHEFIGRCLDAAVRFSREHNSPAKHDIAFTNVINGNTGLTGLSALRFAGIALSCLETPIEFAFIESEFRIEMVLIDEMLIVSTEMSSSHGYYRATLVLSQQTNKVISHWVSCDDFFPAKQELTLLAMATNDYLNLSEDNICK